MFEQLVIFFRLSVYIFKELSWLFHVKIKNPKFCFYILYI